MSEFILREYTQEEYKADMQKLLEEKGLYKAVEDKCDRINSLSSILGYLEHREIQELMCDILFLIELEQGEDKCSDLFNDLKQGLQEAIEIEKAEDCISRQAVLSLAHTHHGNGHEEPYDYVFTDDIKRLPSVYPKSDMSIKKLAEIEQILTDSEFDIPFDGDNMRLLAIAEVLEQQGENIC